MFDSELRLGRMDEQKFKELRGLSMLVRGSIKERVDHAILAMQGGK